jgi:AraC-like DNA-binding protein
LGRKLEAYARGRGIDLLPLAKAVGIDPVVFNSARERVSLDAFCSLLDILATVSGDDCFGLGYAEAFAPGDLGAFSFAVTNAPTIREAVRIYQRYRPLFADTVFCDVEVGLRSTAFSWRYAGLISKPAQFTDLRGALGCKLFGSLSSDHWRPSSVEFIREKPRSVDLHRKVFHTEVRFGARMNIIVFPSSTLDNPVPTANAKLYELMLESCEKELQDIEGKRDLRILVKSKILAVLPTRNVSLAQVASDLGLGDRTLQRRLAALNVTFEQLLERSRQDLSDRLLTTTKMPLAEIGYLCGYSSPSAYSRAAKAWYGIPPLDYRLMAANGN